ncbi:VOC family protein [Streptomyces sp. NPDC054904]
MLAEPHGPEPPRSAAVLRSRPRLGLQARRAGAGVLGRHAGRSPSRRCRRNGGRPRWRVHFKVHDLQAAQAAVLEHGGSLVTDDMTPGGEAHLTVRDPDGGLFTLDQAAGIGSLPPTGAGDV